MIHVIATIEVAAGQREQFLAEFRKVIAPTQAEQGCIEYGPAVDVASGLEPQPAVRPNVVVVVEKWDSLDALRSHLASSHMNEYRERVKNLVTGVTLNVLQPA